MARRKAKETETAPAKKTLVEGHNMGKYYGFEYRGGAVYIAPSLGDPMMEMDIEEQSIKALISAMCEHLEKQMRRLVKQKKQWWVDVQDELSEHFPAEKLLNMNYTPSQRKLVFIEKKE